MSRVIANPRLLGVVFLALLVGAVYLTYGVFTKKFADYDEVTLQTSKIGLQLPSRADVKIRGVIVGEVLDFDTSADGAELTLGIYPSQMDTIPANVTGSIVPKTLFGEKYVSLEIPQSGGDGTLQTGDVIARTEVSIEVEQVLSDLYPLLRTVQPADLNMTLNALATALEGRGTELGENLETVDSYLKRLNPQIPALVEDLRLTSQVSDTYSDVMPEIASILRNTVTTTGTLEDRDAKVHALFTDVSAFADTSRDFLDRNGDNLIRLADVSQQADRRLRQVRPRVPLPHPGHRERRCAPGRGLPRLHPPHRAGDAAQPAARLRPAGRAAVRRDPGPGVREPPQPALVADQPGARPAGLRRRCRRAHRQGHQPDRPRLLEHRHRLRGQRPGDRPAQVPARALAGAAELRRPRPRGAPGRPDGAWGGGGLPMSVLDKKTTIDLTKLLIFIVVTTVATSMLVITIGNISFADSKEYQAEFVDATGVVDGDDVRVAGVKVGTVKDVEIVDRTRALVTFSVDEDTAVTGATNAAIRYRNLVGQRYLSLTQEIGDSAPLDEGATIPVSQTSPALDLTVLFNGFKPLFQALSPSDLNQLSYEIVQVFQGEGGTLEGLLANTASVTSTLADRDQVIGELIDNLNEVLDHLGDRDEQLSDLITTFRTFVGGLKNDRKAILGSLDQISALSVQTADLVSGIRKPFVDDVHQLRRFAGAVDANKAELDRALQVLPIKLEKVGRTAIYGSWFNFYLCSFTGNVHVAGQTIPVDYQTGSDRCDLG